MEKIWEKMQEREISARFQFQSQHYYEKKDTTMNSIESSAPLSLQIDVSKLNINYNNNPAKSKNSGAYYKQKDIINNARPSVLLLPLQINVS
ncbi:unnamed protein product [Rhizophagus irregularis]|nr:unnamed protein product [Rhizophagus irregularis]